MPSPVMLWPKIVNAEQLFDMELTDYSEFLLVKQEFQYLKIVGGGEA